MADPKSKNDKRPTGGRKNKIKVVENKEPRRPNLPPVKEEERPIGNGDTIERIRVGDNRGRR